ncbi:MAG: hypothetical protein J7647_16550 [Cyanobacteria bacterium SBLK]|nr:hypothetical protein [Cyanobacteria bacterium SBLK]
MQTSDRTIQEIYTREICNLSTEEQLRLAALILNNLTQKEPSVQNIDYSDTWTEQDRREIAAFSWQNSAMAYFEE